VQACSTPTIGAPGRNEDDMPTRPQRPSRGQSPPRLLAAFGLLLVLALGAGACSFDSPAASGTDQRKSPEQGRSVDIGGRRLFLECQGTGTPPVVFVAGLGDSGEAAWQMVWSAVARSTRACVYDRAGLGRSDPSPKAATYQGAADDLHGLLGRAHVQGPYVLVGHSLGGLLARLYTHDHPADVTGMVLLDATPVEWFPTVQRLLPTTLRGPLVHNREGFDLSHGLASLAPLDRPGVLDHRPLVVLWAPSQPPPGLPASTQHELARSWEAQQAQLGRLSAASRLQRVAASGHYLQRDQPKLVVAGIDDLLRALQRVSTSATGDAMNRPRRLPNRDGAQTLPSEPMSSLWRLIEPADADWNPARQPLVGACDEPR
jgi:pimeloyl-ACP methyl ester carboxylesterase